MERTASRATDGGDSLTLTRAMGNTVALPECHTGISPREGITHRSIFHASCKENTFSLLGFPVSSPH